MLKIVNSFKVGNMLSVTVDGNCDKIKNGSRLKDAAGNFYEVVSVGMTRYNNPKDISKSTTILIAPCTLEKDSELFIA